MPRQSDPATVQRGDPKPPPFDYRAEAAERIREAGQCLRLHLNTEPRSVDDLEAVERAIVKQTQPRRFLERIEARADQLDRLDREAERANRPAERIERVRFPGMVGRDETLPPTRVPVRDDEDDGREFTR